MGFTSSGDAGKSTWAVLKALEQLCQCCAQGLGCPGFSIGLILLFPRLGKRGKLIPELFGPMDSKGMCGSGADIRSWSSVLAAFSTNSSEELQWERGRITLVFQGNVLVF